MRGGERYLEGICSLFPRADLFVSFHLKGKISSKIEGMNIKNSLIQEFLFLKSKYRYYQKAGSTQNTKPLSTTYVGLKSLLVKPCV